MADKEPPPATNRGRANVVLDQVVVDFKPPILDITQSWAAADGGV
jgi:hypothetical protein